MFFSLIVTQSAQDSPITSRNLRLIGKGCGRSRSSNVIGTSTLTPTRKWWKKILWSYLWLKEEEKKYEKTLLCLSRNHYFFFARFIVRCVCPFLLFLSKKNIASIILLLIFNQHKITCQQCIFYWSIRSINPSITPIAIIKYLFIIMYFLICNVWSSLKYQNQWLMFLLSF